MRFSKLYRFNIAQLWRSPAIKAFVIVVVCGLVWLAVARKLPESKLVEQLCFVFIPVYVTVVTGGSIIEKTERPMMELILAKPFSRRDIILADYLSVVSVFVVTVLFLSIGLWLVFGLRVSEWGVGPIAFFFSSAASIIILYSYIILTGLLIRSASIVIMVWVGYVYFGVSLLEVGELWMSKNGSQMPRLLYDILYSFLPHLLGIYRSTRDIFLNSTWNVIPIITSGISSILVLGVAIAYLNRKDVD